MNRNIHPAYQKALTGEILTIQDITTLIENALQPLQPFTHTIRQDNNNLHIEWTDGPTIPELLSLVYGYETFLEEPNSKLPVRKDFWLTQGGKALLAEQYSTIQDGGSTPGEINDPPSSDAILIQNAAHLSIQVARKLTNIAYQAAFQHIQNRAGEELEGITWNPPEQNPVADQTTFNNLPHLIVLNRPLEQLILETAYSMSFSDYVNLEASPIQETESI